MITKSTEKLLLIGCGDIGIRLAKHLELSNINSSGLRRNTAALPANIIPIACDLNNPAQVQSELKTEFDYVVITLTPSARNEAGYQQAYVGQVDTIINSLTKLSKQPKQILFVSRTSVYAQNNGEWVDEHSPTEPQDYNGRYIKQAEQAFINSELNCSIVRFSGIYGPGRERLMNKVLAKDWDLNDGHYTNRIHADDCAAVLAFLLQQSQSRTLLPIYLASDNEPAPMKEVCAWLAQQLHCDLPVNCDLPESPKDLPANKKAPRNKRCSNKLLCELGFEFEYSSYREGYGAIINNK